LGFDDSICEPRPDRALERARSWAREHDGVVLATGSVYLVGDLLGTLAASDTLAVSRSSPASPGR
jgi:hypothetical protein